MELEQLREKRRAAYPDAWKRITAAWRGPGPDACWLTYPASYLFRTGPARWMLDPMATGRIPGATLGSDPAADLAALNLVLFTHAHGDHFDEALLARLAALPDLEWRVPEHMIGKVNDRVGKIRGRLVPARDGALFEAAALRVRSFPSSHAESGPGGTVSNSEPQTGYLVETPGGQKLLFPGDIRTYAGRESELAAHAPADIVFAHLWLGRGRALDRRPEKDAVDAFCRFFLAARPGRVCLSHLEDFSKRGLDNVWHLGHAEAVRRRLADLAPGVPVSPVRLGEMVTLGQLPAGPGRGSTWRVNRKEKQ